MSNPGDFVVVGSLNIDLVSFVDRLPGPGETLLSRRPLAVHPGGKGGNQAVAAARLGSRTKMIGRVGADPYGELLIRGLAAEGVDCSDIITTAATGSGTAIILVDAQGENAIVVVPGANDLLTPADIDACFPELTSVSVLALQLESPIETCIHAASKARARGAKVILNPSPAAVLPDRLLHLTDILVPNEIEASILSQTTISSIDDAKDAARLLARRGPKQVVITLGEAGVVLADPNMADHYAAPVVDAVDTSCAGDTFMGGLCAGLLEGMPIEQAIALGQAAAAIKVGRTGGQTAMPRRAELSGT